MTDGEQKAEVTLIDFPTNAGPMIADPLQNVNRWRGEIGLPAIDQDALEGISEKIEVDGRPANLVKLIPDATRPEQSLANEATLAAMVTSGERVWFVKMKGSRALVAAQEGRFRSFLKSFRFPADGGANDGD